MATVAVTYFSDRLAEAVGRKQSQLVVGLDPVARALARRGGRRALRVLPRHRRRGGAACGRSQAAVGLLRGARADGVRAFAEVCEYARAAGLLVIADAKRGDIGSTARAYAQAFIPLADAVTVNPYLGGDSSSPSSRPAG